MAKKQDGCFITAALIAIGIMTVWEAFGWWILVILLLCAACWWFFNRKSPVVQSKQDSSIQQENEPTITIGVYTRSIGPDYSKPYQRPDHDGERMFPELRDFVGVGDYDAVRLALRKIAWGTHRYSTPMFKAQLADFIAEFAKIDPLFNGMWPAYKRLISDNPGMIQSKVYQVFPNVSVDDQRYVLYFAEHLNVLKRKKKGNSYTLFLPTQLIDTDEVKVMDDLSAIERQMLLELSERKYIRLPLHEYWSRHLENPEKTLGKLVSLGYFKRADDSEVLDAFYKKAELAMILKEAKLPVSGTKEVVINRILEQLPNVAEELVMGKDLFKPTRTD